MNDLHAEQLATRIAVQAALLMISRLVPNNPNLLAELKNSMLVSVDRYNINGANPADDADIRAKAKASIESLMTGLAQPQPPR